MTEIEIQLLNYEQNFRKFHPKTCMSFYCNRGEREDKGILIATTDCWVCPCGKLKQEYDMDSKDLVKQIEKAGKELVKEANTITKQEVKQIQKPKNN